MKVFEQFRLDMRNECLWRDSERIQLTPKTFSLMAYLVEHSGALVSQSELIENLWPDTFIQPEVLKTHIRALRSTLGDDARNPRFIETHHRRGYRFIAPVSESPDSEKSVPPASATAFVGQESNLEILRRTFELACAGEPQLVFLAGEVGIGKTQLANSFEREVLFGSSRARVVRGQCVKHFGTPEPYYPLLAAISNLIRLPGCDAAVEILANHAPTWLVQFPAFVKPNDTERLNLELAGATRDRMLRELSEAMELIAEELPLIMILEDLHWADPYTVDWLSAFAHGKRKARLMVVATLRPAHVAIANTPLRELRHRLLARKLCTEIDLHPFNEPQVQRFLEQRAPDGQVPPGLTEFLFKHAEGNPFFTDALLDHLMTEGILSNSDGAWAFHWPKGQRFQMVPETIRQLFEDHISSMLSDTERNVLEAASVCGVTFAAAYLELAVGLSQEEVEEVCYKLSRRPHFIRSVGTADLPDGSCVSRFEFVHVLYCEIFYSRIARPRQLRFHRQIAQQIEILCSKNLVEVAPQLAYHFEKCSEWALAAQYLLLASQTEMQRFAYTDAIQVLKHALELLEKLPRPDAEVLRVKLLHRLAEVLTLTDDFFAATEYLEAALPSPALAHNNWERIRILTHLAFLYARISVERCIAAADEALELSLKLEDRSLHARARMIASFWRLACEGWSAHHAQQCARAFAELEQGSAPIDMAHGLVRYGAVQCISSHHREGLAKLQLGIPVLISSASPFYEFGQRSEAWTLLTAGEWGQALVKIEAKIDHARRNSNRISEKTWLLWLARARQLASDHEGAIDCLKQSNSIPSTRETAWIHEVGMWMHAASEVELDQEEEARQRLNLADVLSQYPITLLGWYWRLLRFQCEFEMQMGAGSAKEALEAAQTFLAASETTAERTWQALAWEASARAAIADGDLAHAQSAIDSAIEILERYDLPLAHWKVHSTAMLAYSERADHHRAAAAKTLLQLAESLRDYPVLRNTFLSSPEVSSLMQDLE